METAVFGVIDKALASKYLEKNQDNRRSRKWYAISQAVLRRHLSGE